MEFTEYDPVIETLQIGSMPVRLAIPQDVDAVLLEEADPYWSEVWDSSVALAGFLLEEWQWTGKDLIELGCGVGLAGVVAAMQGARVLLTDYNKAALRFAAHNLRLNGCETARVGYLDWYQPDLDRTFDGILAADVVYDSDNWDTLLDLWPRLLCEQGVVLLAEPGRLHAGEFLERAASRGLIWEVRYREPQRIRSRRRVGVYRMYWPRRRSNSFSSSQFQRTQIVKY